MNNIEANDIMSKLFEQRLKYNLRIKIREIKRKQLSRVLKS